mgnify:CR=1 FL=1
MALSVALHDYAQAFNARIGDALPRLAADDFQGARRYGEQLRARSELFPQVFASLGYTRTLASQFEALAGSGIPISFRKRLVKA